jgi:diketogulonate reductase-like aldo/keto reductase
LSLIVPLRVAEATSETHVDENFKVLDWELSDDDMKAISDLKTQNKNVAAGGFLKENGPYATESEVGCHLLWAY